MKAEKQIIIGRLSELKKLYERLELITLTAESGKEDVEMVQKILVDRGSLISRIHKTTASITTDFPQWRTTFGSDSEIQSLIVSIKHLGQLITAADERIQKSIQTSMEKNTEERERLNSHAHAARVYSQSPQSGSFSPYAEKRQAAAYATA